MRLLHQLPASLALALMFGGSALAGDYERIPDLRPSTFDVYVGAFAASTTVDSNYTGTAGGKRDLDGTGYGGGIRAGVDYGTDDWLIGVVGDWTFGGKVAEKDNVKLTYDVPNLATARLRAGATVGYAVIYATGGYAQAEMTITQENGGEKLSDSGWSSGWTLGGGVDFALTDSLSLGVEYLFINLDDMKYEATNSKGDTYTLKQEMDAIHSVRVGMNYAFHI